MALAEVSPARRGADATPVRPAAVYVVDTMADVRMVEGFAERFRLTVLAPSSLEGRLTTSLPRPVDRCRVVLLPGGRGAFLLKAARWLRRHRRCIDVAFALDNTSAALSAGLSRLAGGPTLVLQVGRPTEEYVASRAFGGEWRLRDGLRRAVVRVLVAVNERVADGIGATSDYCSAQCRRHNKVVRSIAAYGIDPELFAPRWSKGEARRLTGLPTSAPVVLYRSRIAPEKDPDTFLRAAALLRDRGRPVTAVYVGGEHGAFADRAARLGVDVVARDAVPWNQLPVWYAAADVTVQTSHAEGLGMSPLESLACEVPVVVSNVGGLPEVARWGEAGLLVPPRDPKATAEAIARLLDDPALRAELGKRGRAWVLERYGAVAAFDAWTELAAAAAGARRGA